MENKKNEVLKFR